MFERFTDRARRVVVLAQEDARGLHHAYIGTEHLLLGLIHEGEGLAAKALSDIGVTAEAARERVLKTVGPGEQLPSGHMPYTPRAKKVLEYALREALQLGHNYIGTEHMLLALLREGEGVGCQVLGQLGVLPSELRRSLLELMGRPPGRLEGSGAVGARLRDRLKRMLDDVDAGMVVVGFEDVVMERVAAGDGAAADEVKETLSVRWRRQ